MRPGGVTLASSDFGSFSHKVTVGRFGSSEVLAFDAVTGRFEGTLQDPTNKPININGLWALAFGSGVTSSDPSGQPDSARSISQPALTPEKMGYSAP
jgi:hypothetical protein